MPEIKIKTLKGKHILPFIEELAILRIAIFKEYPYCYDGSMKYESEYLKTYTDCNESTITIVMHDKKVIGASTAIPLEYEIEAFKNPFRNENQSEIFYLGESVLLPEFRGKNIYRHLFQERETAALNYGCKRTTFCAVERPQPDKRKPKNYASLEPVWSHFKYIKNEKRSTYFPWKDIGDHLESTKQMVYWEKWLTEYKE